MLLQGLGEREWNRARITHPAATRHPSKEEIFFFTPLSGGVAEGRGGFLVRKHRPTVNGQAQYTKP